MAYKPADSCWIYPETPSADLKTLALPSLPLNSTTSDLFVTQLYGVESCQLQDDIFLHPFIKGFIIGISLLWLLITSILVCVFCKYRSLKVRYSKLSEDTSAGGGEENTITQGGEIEMRSL